MSDENGAGANYLASLRQSSTPQAAAAKPALATVTPASRANAALPSSASEAKKAEKRKNPRYRCQGSVHLREATSSVATWATFTDISTDGCYVEAAAGYGVGANLTLTIEANGFRVETAAVVRVAYPGLGMGISFTRMSETDRGKLRQLIDSTPQRPIIRGSHVTTQSLSAQPEPSPSITNSDAALQAMRKFFEDRHMMGREEFLRILRNHQ